MQFDQVLCKGRGMRRAAACAGHGELRRPRSEPRDQRAERRGQGLLLPADGALIDRKSTRLNSSHVSISYAVFCLKKKTHTNGVGIVGEPASSSIAHAIWPH